jgi:hypothetical protein
MFKMVLCRRFTDDRDGDMDRIRPSPVLMSFDHWNTQLLALTSLIAEYYARYWILNIFGGHIPLRIGLQYDCKMMMITNQASRVIA